MLRPDRRDSCGICCPGDVDRKTGLRNAGRISRIDRGVSGRNASSDCRGRSGARRYPAACWLGSTASDARRGTYTLSGCTYRTLPDHRPGRLRTRCIDVPCAHRRHHRRPKRLAASTHDGLLSASCGPAGFSLCNGCPGRRHHRGDETFSRFQRSGRRPRIGRCLPGDAARPHSPQLAAVQGRYRGWDKGDHDRAGTCRRHRRKQFSKHLAGRYGYAAVSIGIQRPHRQR